MGDEEVDRGSGEIEFDVDKGMSLYAEHQALGPAYSSKPILEDPDNVPHYYGSTRGQVIDHIPDNFAKDPAAVAEAKDWAEHLRRRKPN